MRIKFKNIDRPKKAAKLLSRLADRPLSRCKKVFAEGCGYRDWHELEQQIEPKTALVAPLAGPESISFQIDFALKIASALDVSDDDAQYALSQLGIIGDQPPSMLDQLAIRGGCLRRTSLKEQGRRQRGSVGRLKTQYRNGELVILKRFGRPTYVVTDKSPDAVVADFEFISPRVPPSLFIPMRFYLAYGMWTEGDGSRVLFSRDYAPLWRLQDGRRAVRTSPWERIKFEKQEWFWNDVSTPWSSIARYKEELKRLEELRITGLPKLVQALPLLVLRDDVGSMRHAIKTLQNMGESGSTDLEMA